MSSNRQRDIEDLVKATIGMPNQQRAVFLDRECAGDQKLRDELERRLGEPLAFNLVGKSLDRYRIVRELGRGGMGAVFAAVDEQRGATVALKALLRVTARSILAFKREFRSLQNLTHTNLVQLHELAVADGIWFFTMEFVDGRDLLAYLRGPRAVDSTELDEMASAATLVPDDDDVGWDATTLPAVAMPADLPTPATSADEERVRAVFAQVADALCALHDAGKVHRDIKPTNVMVTADGRVVVLDFGLIFEIAGDAHGAGQLDGAGTPAFMAPEQAKGSVTPAADWYSVGAMLFRVLTGRLPFSAATPIDLLVVKQSFTPPHPRKFMPDVPEKLADLCHAMLAVKPEDRPSGAEIVLRLGGAASSSAAPATPVSSGAELNSERADCPPFVGREAELATLRAAYRELLTGRSATVFVHGESGFGKSALIRHFVESVRRESADVVVLTGRCRERESIPYKALDGVVDDLSGFMRQLPAEVAEALVPRHAFLLTRVFPVLGQVQAMAEAPASERTSEDPQLMVRHAFAALRELLCRLAERQPLIIVIDDLQWTDRDSAFLLEALLDQPDEPAMLLLGSRRTSRESEGADGRVAGESLFEQMSLPDDVRHVELGPLRPDRASELAKVLLKRMAGDSLQAALAAGIADDAAGHPMYIGELVRYACRVPEADNRRAHLDSVIWERVCALAPEAQTLVELVALAGAPLTETLLLQASGVAPEDASRAFVHLRAAQLIRSWTAGEIARIEPYHDRVRESVQEHLPVSERRALHARLVTAMENSQSMAQSPLLVRHLERAGEFVRAAQLAQILAVQFSEQLAFDRSAALYGTALRLGEYDSERSRELRLALADALGNAGRGPEAAELCRVVAEEFAGEDSDTAFATRLDLRGKEAMYWLLSGHVEEGTRSLREAMAEAGIAYPKSPRRAMLSILWHRARLRVRGLKFTARSREEISPRERSRLDMYFYAGVGLSRIDYLRGADFIIRALLYALKVGDTARISRFLSYDACYRIFAGPDQFKRGRELYAEARRITGETKPDASVIWAQSVGHFMQGHSLKAIELCDQAAAVARDIIGDDQTSTDAFLNLVILRSFVPGSKINAYNHIGMLPELTRASAPFRLAARRNKDRYSEFHGRCFQQILLLARDERRAARVSIEDNSWTPPTEGYHFLHLLWATYSLAPTALYLGDREIMAAVLSELNTLIRSSLRYIVLGRLDMEWRACRLRLILSATAGDTTEALKVARRTLRRMKKQTHPWVLTLMPSLRASIAHCEGHTDDVITHLREAAAQAEVADMLLLSACFRYRLGEFVGGAEGRELVAAAESWMVAQGVVNPARMANLGFFKPREDDDQELAVVPAGRRSMPILTVPPGIGKPDDSTSSESG